MKNFLSALGLSAKNIGVTATSNFTAEGEGIISSSPIDGSILGEVSQCSSRQYDLIITESQQAFTAWRNVPAPKRGELIRDFADEVRKKKKELGLLITTEMGKTLSEGEGEVQEVIDIADFAVGLSRQLYGLTMHSERPLHRMYEQWHPLGVVGVITAFNFPMAVWAWNACLAAICGNTVVWKPSELTPLCAVALNKIAQDVATKHGFPGVFSLAVGGAEVGEAIARDRRVALVSATGSTRMGKAVGMVVAERMGRTLLELGGNNALIVLDDADQKMALTSVVFGAVGTAGQRCTTTRRVILQRGIAQSFTEKLVELYKKIPAGDPRTEGVLLGPLVNEKSVLNYEAAIAKAKAEGGEVLYGGARISGLSSSNFVLPTIIRAHPGMSITKEETFAPIVYIMEVANLDEAIAIQNDVPQGLSSSLFTLNLRHAETFLSCLGSDCGIANVNIGTSGAEIGGAFGGEKETGGGREAGSDSWRQYMRRQTNTINFGTTLPLAQGIKFSLD